MKMNLVQVWNFMQEAKEKNLTLHCLAKVRESDADGGVKPGGVHHWLNKALKMYHGRAQLCFLNCLHFNLVTDSSCHGCKDTLVSVVYSHENDSVAFAPSQFMKPGKVTSPGEMNVSSEVERILARREQERLHSYRLMQAISNQVFEVSHGQVSLETLVPPDAFCLMPLKPGDRFEVWADGAHFFYARDENPVGILQDLGPVNSSPLLTVLMDQGLTGTAAGAFMISRGVLCHFKWDKIHRLIRDIKLASQRSRVTEAILMTSFVWSINYKPFGSGAFFEEKNPFWILSLRVVPVNLGISLCFQ